MFGSPRFSAWFSFFPDKRVRRDIAKLLKRPRPRAQRRAGASSPLSFRARRMQERKRDKVLTGGGGALYTTKRQNRQDTPSFEAGTERKNAMYNFFAYISRMK